MKRKMYNHCITRIRNANTNAFNTMVKGQLSRNTATQIPIQWVGQTETRRDGRLDTRAFGREKNLRCSLRSCDSTLKAYHYNFIDLCMFCLKERERRKSGKKKGIKIEPQIFTHHEATGVAYTQVKFR